MRKLKLDLDYGDDWDFQKSCDFTRKIIKMSVQSAFENQTREQMREVLALFKKLDSCDSGVIQLTDDEWTRLYNLWKKQKVKYFPEVLEQWEMIDKEICPDDYAEGI